MSVFVQAQGKKWQSSVHVVIEWPLNVNLQPNSWSQFRSKYFGQNFENASNFSFFLLLLYKLVFPYFSISFLLDTIIQWMIYFDKRTFEREKNC